MGLCSSNRISIPKIGSEEIGIINDEYVDRHCKPKKKKRAAQPQAPPQEAQPSQPAQSSHPAGPSMDPTLQNWFYHTWDQN
ncbi:hypothetical protein A2U01_0066247, partial [Trifolium medium]|nr:hypothetical protein [Trifolium medium]